MRVWTAERTEQFRSLWDNGLKRRAIMREMNLTVGQVVGKSRTLNLHYRGQHKPWALKSDHPAAIEGRTLFRGAVRSPADVDVLKTGHDTRKLGARVLKGPWKGFRVFSLTLEERATCPRSCQQWFSCYGNRMHMARRWKAGPEMVARLWAELAVLQDRYPRGFVVRLHILGDFYSLPYVWAWKAMLAEFPALRVFGYTAWGAGTIIGDAVSKLSIGQWSRFAVRRSGGAAYWDEMLSMPASIVVDRAEDAPPDAIICPAQTHKNVSCASCGLCWHTKRRIAFLKH